jgi:hypothetical protein
MAVAVGALLAVVGLLGLSSAMLAPGWSEDPLDLPGYCEWRHGRSAGASRPPRSSAWQCGVWRNGVWGLETVDLDVVCAWQRGDEAELHEVNPPPEGDWTRSVLCAI